MPTAFAVRPLQPADLDPLRWVIYRAYLEVLIQLYGREAAAGYEVRSQEFMELYVQRDPAGGFVAETAGGVPAGAVFCFVWGQVGWFGSLAVSPEWQGQGIGQALTRQALEYLEASDCRRIGLETWPHSPLVRHLYGKFGFRPMRSTVKFSRPVSVPGTDTGGAAGGALVAGAGSVSWLTGGAGSGVAGLSAQALEEATGAVHAVTLAQAAASPAEPPPDYRAEVAAPVRAGWADLVLVRDGAGTPAGYALCYLRRPGGGPVAALDVRLLAVTPGEQAPAVLDQLLCACDARAHGVGLATVTVDVNLRHAGAAALLRERRFRPVYELLRMEREVPGFDAAARSAVIDCARWAG